LDAWPLSGRAVNDKDNRISILSFVLPAYRIAPQLPRNRGGRSTDHRSDLPQRLTLGTQYGDLFTLGEGQAPTLQITAPPRPDTTGLKQDPAPGTPARIDPSNGISDEITSLHPGPKNLQKIRPHMN
jgi:hypothetical protein